MDKDEQLLKKGKETTSKQVFVKPAKEESSSMDEDINTVDIEEQLQLLMIYAIQAEKAVSIKEIGESSSTVFEHEGIQSDERIVGECSERLLYTCQILETFGIMKCSTDVPYVTTKEFIPKLHILVPSVHHFINMTRFNGFPDYPFCFGRKNIAIVPYVDAVTLSQCSLLEAEDNASEVDSEEWAREHVVYDSEVEILFDDIDASNLFKDEKSRREAQSLTTSRHVENGNEEETGLVSNADGNKENDQRRSITEELAELKIWDRNLSISTWDM